MSRNSNKCLYIYFFFSFIGVVNYEVCHHVIIARKNNVQLNVKTDVYVNWIVCFWTEIVVESLCKNFDKSLFVVYTEGFLFVPFSRLDFSPVNYNQFASLPIDIVLADKSSSFHKVPATDRWTYTNSFAT